MFFRHRRPMPCPTAGAVPLLTTATGAFPVPEAICPSQFPPCVVESYTRLLAGPPKPSVSPMVMNMAQGTMLSPDKLFC